MYPVLRRKTTRRRSLNGFRGYDHRLRAAEGTFYETENLSTAFSPLLSTRERRGVYAQLDAAQGLAEKDAPAWVDGGTLYYNGVATGLTGLSEGEKQLVSMGAYLCVFPDKLYFNTADDSDFGSMEASWSYTGSVLCAPCTAQGEELENVTAAASEPPAPGDGDYWLDTGECVLSCWSAAMEQWITVESAYTKLSFTSEGQLPALFSLYDGVRISGLPVPSLNGSKILYGIGGSENESDFIVLQGEPVEGGTFSSVTLSLRRCVPAMDFVCQCRNRLWGCRYGNDGEGNLNELYACALGDFKNWEQFMGLSTDSWRAGVGSDGVWTGAVNYLGTPIFFKENCLHRVGVSAEGAHQVEETVCRGVEKGSSKSLIVVDETLFYKSRADVCVYQGGFPESISAPFGEKRYHAAVAGAADRKYYLSMLDENGTPQLFVYDLRHGLWCREDSLRAEAFASVDNELLCLSDNTIWALGGRAGTLEKSFRWSAETGLLGLENGEGKYIARVLARMILERGAQAEVFAEYESSGVWETLGRVVGGPAGSVEIPLRVRRCDHLRLKLAGEGGMKLLALEIEYTEG